MNLWIERLTGATKLRLALSKMTLLRYPGAPFLVAAILALQPAARANAAPLVLDRAKSHVDIAVEATVDSFVAHLEDFQVAITLDPGSGRVEAAAFRANLSAVKTGRADRDHDMSVWLQTSEFPQVAFELETLERGPNGAFTARGQVQLHGERHEVSFPVRITADQGLTTIDGVAALDTREFGLPIIRKFWILTVDPVVHVRFHLQGAPAR